MKPSSHKGWHGMGWKKVEYSRTKIIKSGKAVAKRDYSKISKLDAHDIINNWRAAHAFPMQVFYVNLSRKAKKIKGSIVAQRLKRLGSILAKLQRYPNMDLYGMQDLGGCRVIVNDITEVYAIINSLKKSKIRHELIDEDDYIQKPKPDGYRSVHLVYQYYSDKKHDYDGHKIEIQFRSKLQHLWATAVEILSLPTRTNLKAGQGDKGTLRSLALISALFSLKEETPVGENMPRNGTEIVRELESIGAILNMISALSALNLSVSTRGREPKNEGYYLLIINFDKNEVSYIYYKKGDITRATTEYEKLEANTQINAVLVSASNMNTLRKAYPNYFADTREFVAIVKDLMKKYSTTEKVETTV